MTSVNMHPVVFDNTLPLSEISAHVKMILENQTVSKEASLSSYPSLSFKKITYKNSTYVIVQYKKTDLKTNKNIRPFRSLIYNPSGSLVAYGPGKSVPYDEFINKHFGEDTLSSFENIAHTNNYTYTIEEFVEGTMINMFWEPVLEAWEIATKGIMSATGTFFKKQGKMTTSFREMFWDACSYCSLTEDMLDKSLCYSFVFVHPENRIVNTFSTPMVWLIDAYAINNTEHTINRVANLNELQDQFNETTVEISIKYHNELFATPAQLKDKVEKVNHGPQSMGIVIRCVETGERTKLRNPVFEHARQLRGNNPKLEFQYLELRKKRRVQEYLRYFPNDADELEAYEEKIHEFTQNLYDNYVSCFITKLKFGPKTTLTNYPFEYRTHMYNLHQFYKNDLKGVNLHDVDESGDKLTKMCITKHMVIQYVNSLPSNVLMFAMNYHHRKNSEERTAKENKKTDTSIDVAQTE